MEVHLYKSWTWWRVWCRWWEDCCTGEWTKMSLTVIIWLPPC